MFSGEYYQGVETDTLQDHIEKCPKCKYINSQLPGYIVPHGQIYKNPYLNPSKEAEKNGVLNDTNSKLTDD